MIKAEELKINNWFEYDGEYYQVNSINEPKLKETDYRVSFRNNSKTKPVYCLHPIPLTEEILIKCGFGKVNITHRDNSVSYGVFKKYPILIEENKLYENEDKYTVSRFAPSEINETNYLLHMDYIHQLQNIYFALTGEELKINL